MRKRTPRYRGCERATRGRGATGRLFVQGFGIIELLVALALGLILALASLPLMLSLQKAGVGEADRSVQLAQSRVAIARFERDTRLAGPTGCPFAVTGAIVDASANRLVMLVREQADAEPFLICWEITGSNLMRRRGLCPTERPTAINTALFFDNKTMLEGVRAGSRFLYRIGAKTVEPSLVSVRSSAVDAVELCLDLAAAPGDKTFSIAGTGRVGR